MTIANLRTYTLSMIIKVNHILSKFNTDPLLDSIIRNIISALDNYMMIIPANDFVWDCTLLNLYYNSKDKHNTSPMWYVEGNH